jgi:hypothetical protein
MKNLKLSSKSKEFGKNRGEKIKRGIIWCVEHLPFNFLLYKILE